MPDDEEFTLNHEEDMQEAADDRAFQHFDHWRRKAYYSAQAKSPPPPPNRSAAAVDEAEAATTPGAAAVAGAPAMGARLQLDEEFLGRVTTRDTTVSEAVAAATPGEAAASDSPTRDAPTDVEDVEVDRLYDEWVEESRLSGDLPQQLTAAEDAWVERLLAGEVTFDAAIEAEAPPILLALARKLVHYSLGGG